jgi:hypothetical protein
MSARSCTPLGAIARGLLAGTIGTAAMTAYQTAVAKARESESSDTPAKVGERIIQGVLEREVPAQRKQLLNEAMHWSYGTSWGAVYGVLRGSSGASALRLGTAFGLGVWSASLAHLPAMKLAPPVWEQPPAEVALDASYHIVYGLAVALAYATVDR